MLFRCAVAAKYNVAIVIGDLETGDPEGSIAGIVSSPAPTNTIRIMWSFNDASWYYGQETKVGGTETKEDLGYVNLNRYRSDVPDLDPRIAMEHAEAVHVHKLEHKENDEAFFDALVCALNHDLLVRSPNPRLHSVVSVKAAIRKYFKSEEVWFNWAWKQHAAMQMGLAHSIKLGGATEI